MPNSSKLGSGLDAIFGSDINSLLDDIQNGTEPDGVTTTNTSLKLTEIRSNPYQPVNTICRRLANMLSWLKEMKAVMP